MEWLIGNLNENGFLEATKEETQAKLSIDESTWEEALSVLQWLDPAGIGARDLRECLLIQLSRLGLRDSIPWKVVHDCFGLLQKLKIPTIARRLDCTNEEVQDSIKEIGQLEPRPGRQLSSPQAPTVVPDLVVDRGPDGFWYVAFNDKTVPSLRVSRSYQDMVRRGSKASTDEKKYVRDKLNSATWLLRSIEQRKGTMLKVMHAILESQSEFFEEGPGHLKPLVLQDIADKVKMHISTVSRVTNEKYVQTPHGVCRAQELLQRVGDPGRRHRDQFGGSPRGDQETDRSGRSFRSVVRPADRRHPGRNQPARRAPHGGQVPRSDGDSAREDEKEVLSARDRHPRRAGRRRRPERMFGGADPAGP